MQKRPDQSMSAWWRSSKRRARKRRCGCCQTPRCGTLGRDNVTSAEPWPSSRRPRKALQSLACLALPRRWAVPCLLRSAREGCGEGGDGVSLLGGELDVRGRGVGTEFVDGFGSDDHRGHGRTGEEPRQGDLRHLQPPLAGQPIELAGDSDLAVGEAGAAVALVPGER